MIKVVKHGLLEMIIGQRKIFRRIIDKRGYQYNKLRLNMINAKDIYKSSEINTKCEFCESDDTTEYLFEFSILKRLAQEEMKAINLESVDNIQELR